MVVVDVVFDNLYNMSEPTSSRATPQGEREKATYPKQAEINRHDDERQHPSQQRHERTE